MNTRLPVSVIVVAAVSMIILGCSGAVTRKGNQVNPADTIDPFDYGDEFIQVISERDGIQRTGDGSGLGEKTSDETSPSLNNRTDYETTAPSGEQGLASQGNALGYRIQIGAYENKDNAEKAAQAVRSKIDLPVYIIYQAPFYRVRVGDFTEKGQAERYVRLIREQGFQDARWVPTQINTQ